ncbi:apolipoprotein N-acyltransferase [bacterium]|nr:apolipoprotein N-acyltransferase [bacterium]
MGVSKLRPHRERRVSRSEMLLLIIGCAALALAFPPANLWPLGLVGLVPLFRVVGKCKDAGARAGFRTGLIAGIAFFLPLIFWIAKLASNEMDNPVLMSGPLVLLVLMESLCWGGFSLAAPVLIRRGRFPRVLVLPLVWTAFEYLRSLSVLGFTWGNIGYVGTTIPAAVQFASLTGLFGVTFWFALVNVLVLEVIEGRRDRRVRTAALAGLVLTLVLPLAHGFFVMSRPLSSERVRVAVIQPNIEGKRKWDPAFRHTSYESLEKLTREAAKHGPDLIIWPETAVPTYLRTDRVQLDWIRRLAADVDAAILTGAPDFEGRAGEEPQYFNSALLVLPDSPELVRYDKIHLVPFGEVIPFESTFPILEQVDFGEADFKPGTRRVVFDARGIRFSTLICYEAIFPGLVREFVEGGAELLVNITNDVWYGRTSMPSQHASMALMRSIENGRSLARSANSGVSLLADPRGRIIKKSRIFTEAYLVADLPVVTESTFYTRTGEWAAWLASALVGLGLLLSMRRRSVGS